MDLDRMSTQSGTVEFQACQAPADGGIWSLIGPLERVAAAVLLIVLLPAMLLAAAAIALLSRRSPLVAHLRTGQFGVPFWTLKFRTMWGPPEGPGRAGFVEYIVDERGPEFKCSADPRVSSAFARFCRRFSIDELPQLVNVLRGEMSLVGPRPMTQGELKRHYGADASETLLVKPGITGLWQVMGRSRLSFDLRRELDLFLVRNRSLRLYLKILIRTVPAVLNGKHGW
jgi:lipopolysaccharide/colanic/teichoic acid biosynthesis glycosyltransferase